MKKVLSILIIMILAFTMVACDNNNEDTNTNMTNEANEMNKNESAKENDVEPVEEVAEEVILDEGYTFTDGMGREVTISEEPMKIISLAPSMTEMVYALGLGDRLIGRTDFCTYPEEASTVVSVGTLQEVSLESVIAMDPDIILMSGLSSEELALQFEEAGITVAVLTAHESFDGVYDVIGQMGMIFNAQAAADAVIADMKADVEEVLTLVKDLEKKTVYYVVGYGEWGDYTATGDTFIHELLEMAGGSNVASDGEGWSYNMESLLEKDPEYMICNALGDKAILEVTEGYMELTAVKEARLIEINQDLLSRQGPRLAEGLKAVAMILHPTVFE